MATKNETIENVKVNESAKVENESAKVSAPTAEQIAAAKVEQKHQKEISDRYAMEAPKEVEVTKFVGAYVLGVYRPTSDRKNSDKTFYKIFYKATIYDGYSATEFCDSVGIERKHRGSNTPKVITLMDKLTALKNAIEAIESTESDFVNFAKIVAKKIENEQLEGERTAFVAKYAAAIPMFAEITEAICAKIYGDDVLALAKKLGYKFSDTKTESKTESNK